MDAALWPFYTGGVTITTPVPLSTPMVVTILPVWSSPCFCSYTSLCRVFVWGWDVVFAAGKICVVSTGRSVILFAWWICVAF